MDRSELRELHYIVPIENLASIAKQGILSHAWAERVEHRSVADPTVQSRRSRRRLPSGRMLHEYANLYLNARNAMLYKRCAEGGSRDLCVLRISQEVLDIPGTYVTSGNAASDWTRVAPGAAGLTVVDRDATFIRYWGTDDSQAAHVARSKTMAEVLVPGCVPPSFVTGAYAGNRQIAKRVLAEWSMLEAVVCPDIFFGFTGEGA